MSTTRVRSVFDANYFRTFYGHRPVHDRRSVAPLAAGVFGLCASWGVPMRSVLDVGAGPGYWGAWLATNRPRVRYVGVDVSPYACGRYGHQQADIADWRPPRPCDLVVCQDVLQYLDDRRAAAAIVNLAAATRSVLYVQVPTGRDLRTVVDRELSDLAVVARPASWYRERLTTELVEIGAGLFHRRGAVQLFELEVAASRPSGRRRAG